MKKFSKGFQQEIDESRKIAEYFGHYSKKGGWIVNEDNKPICQGWSRYCLLVEGFGWVEIQNGKWYVQWNKLPKR